MRKPLAVLAVAALVGAILLLLIGTIARSVTEPAPRAAGGAAGRPSLLRLPAGPVDLEALPGPLPTLRPRRLMAASAVALAVILLLVYFGWRQGYVLEWAACWVLAAYGMALLSRRYSDAGFARAAISLFGLLTLGGALLMLKSGWTYARQPLPRGARWLLAGLAVWILSGRFIPRPTLAMIYFLVLAGVNGGAAVKYLLGLPGGRSLGAVTLGLALTMVAATNLLVAFSIPAFTTDGVLVFRVLVINALAYAFAAVGMHLLIFEDTTREVRRTNEQLAAAQEQLRHQAITDPLTGCYNRRFLDEVAPRELERQRRYRQPLSVLFIDINGFKSINDQRGHQVGDRVLQHVATVVRQQLRQSDYVFRWGGDEFLVLLTSDGAEATRKVATLKLALAQTPLPGEPSGVTVAISAGVEEVPIDALDLLTTITRADEQMYREKFAPAR